MADQTIVKLDDRSHILLRPSMYIGQIVPGKYNEWISIENGIAQQEVEYVPALLKIINEIIDNSVDEYIKTQGEFANKVTINIDSKSITIQDNGRGIPVKKDPGSGIYLPMLCFGHAKSGSNFDDSNNQSQIGTNGVGSFATVCFSEYFQAETDDGENSYTVVFKNNAESYTEKLGKSKSRGTKVYFEPDLKKFSISKIDDTSINLIKTRIQNLSMTYNGIEFKFNNKKINVKSSKDFLKNFGNSYEFIENENIIFAVFPNTEDDFRQFSYINGLRLIDGGTHITLSLEHITRRIQSNLIKKYKSIKPGDIKNKLLIVVVGKNFKNVRFNSQTKECLTNSGKEVSEWMGDISWDDFCNKILKNKNIVEPITEVYRIKEELKKRAELKALDGKTKERINHDKYTKAVGSNDMIIICEGASAKNGLLPSLGRKGIAYYELKGKPMNAIKNAQTKFTNNEELSTLYKIIKQEGFKKVVIGADADLDGYSITGLIIAFLYKYLPDTLKDGSTYMLRTPIASKMQNKKPIKWVYKYDEIHTLGDNVKFYKGYGSWKPQDLQNVISIDGMDRMLEPIEYTQDDVSTIMAWYSTDNANDRKEMIKNNDFDLIKI